MQHQAHWPPQTRPDSQLPGSAKFIVALVTNPAQTSQSAWKSFLYRALLATAFPLMHLIQANPHNVPTAPGIRQVLLRQLSLPKTPQLQSPDRARPSGFAGPGPRSVLGRLQPRLQLRAGHGRRAIGARSRPPGQNALRRRQTGATAPPRRSRRRLYATTCVRPALLGVCRPLRAAGKFQSY